MESSLSGHYFAYLDILGFSELVRNNSIQDLDILYRDVIEKRVNIAITKGMFVEEIESGKISPDPRMASVNSMIISDSILVWTALDDVWSFLELFMAVRGILHSSMHYGLPLRGAISHGDLLVQENTFKTNYMNNRITVAGSPLIEAYDVTTAL